MKRQDVATKPETRAQLVETLRDAWSAIYAVARIAGDDYENPMAAKVMDILDAVAVRRIGSVLRSERIEPEGVSLIDSRKGER